MKETEYNGGHFSCFTAGDVKRSRSIYSSHAYKRRMTTRTQTEKASIRTPMVARHGNDILVVTDLEKVLYDDAVDRAASHSQAGVSTSGNNRPFCFSEVHDCWETSRNTYGH